MTSDVARVFDAMAGSYDELEPWYEHLYAVLHRIVRDTLALPRAGRVRRALDVGCGTGYQTALLAALGYDVHGVDVSAGVLARARDRVPRAALVRADATRLPYADASFDAMTCCGSTLSLVDDPARALREMGRVLAPGGRLLLECEHRWSLDLLWALLSSLTGDRLGFGLTPRRALAALRPPWRASLVTDYPLAITRADVAVLRLRLFTRTDLDASLADAGLVTVRAWGIHVTTNLFPSTVLHRERLGRLASAAYRALCFVDDRIRAWPPARYAANSLVLLAVKRP
jgi:SAM-dependent methyltransferase